jgi:hypothetical protein
MGPSNGIPSVTSYGRGLIEKRTWGPVLRIDLISDPIPDEVQMSPPFLLFPKPGLFSQP